MTDKDRGLGKVAQSAECVPHTHSILGSTLSTVRNVKNSTGAGERAWHSSLDWRVDPRSHLNVGVCSDPPVIPVGWEWRLRGSPE